MCFAFITTATAQHQASESKQTHSHETEKHHANGSDQDHSKKSAPDHGKLSVTVFADAYFAADHHSSTVNGMGGFWFRRIYLTYDRELEGGFAARLNFEAASPGDFTTDDKLYTKFKDAYISHHGEAGHAYFGLTINPLIGSYEKYHKGYRAIERTPLDLFKMSGSRDTGIGFKGHLSGKTDYWLMVGNDSSVGSETNKGKAFYLNLNHELAPNLDLNGTAVYADKDGSDHWTTAAVFLGYKGDKIEGSLFYAHQARSIAAGPDVSLDIVSLYLSFHSSDTVKPFFRADFVNGAVPKADKIKYLKLSKDASPSLFIVGVDMKLSKNVHLIPNIEWVTYSNPTSGPTPGNDMFIRLTVVAKF
ncbi:MAG: hypothetical protein IH944_03085 [Armatimonadetes bacterium]|nr:hypothetical protein [Armatimonadota bacterium]